ncbi:unnamed protein product [marine sediment metagenome]|uniref:Uncharacterized protein n=1 Tax=marine sediment metagenome TaxID=412755 RepID=X1DXD9_9ZZZZ
MVCQRSVQSPGGLPNEYSLKSVSQYSGGGAVVVVELVDEVELEVVDVDEVVLVVDEVVDAVVVVVVPASKNSILVIKEKP